MKSTISLIYNELKYRGLVKNQSDFAHKLGVGKQYMSNLMGSDKPLSANISSQLNQLFGINEFWIKSNGIRGSMFITTKGYDQESAPTLLREEQIPYATAQRIAKQVPILGDVVAGNTQELAYNDTQYDVSESIDVGDLLRDSEAAFTVHGNSMVPSYPSGCVLGIRRNLDGFIQPGETYVIVTKSNRVFKRLYNTNDLLGYECFSDNVMVHEKGALSGKYFYPPFIVDKADVLQLWDVVGMIRRNRTPFPDSSKLGVIGSNPIRITSPKAAITMVSGFYTTAHEPQLNPYR